MGDVKTDLEALTAAAAEIGQRATSDPAYLADLKANQVDALSAAGVSAGLIVQLLQEEGAGEDEVAAYGFSPASAGFGGVGFGGGAGGGIVINGHCVGTCKSVTIHVVVSAQAAGAAGAPGSAGARS